MKAFIALLCLIAGLCLAAAQDYPDQGGYDCPGKVKRITCYEDLSGVLTGVIIDNESGARTSYCNAGTTGGQPTRVLELADNENIVQITACRGAYYGYNSVTFVTDAGNTRSCGSATYDYKPPGYDSYAVNYQTNNFRAASVSSPAPDIQIHRTTSRVQMRNMLQSLTGLSAVGAASTVDITVARSTEDPQGAGELAADNSTSGNNTVSVAHHHARRDRRERVRNDIDKFKRRNCGWGWDSQCKVYISPRQPVWSNSGCPSSTGSCGTSNTQGTNPPWYLQSDRWGHDRENNRYGRTWDSYSSYYTYSGSTSQVSSAARPQPTRYYKSYKLYKRLTQPSTSAGVQAQHRHTRDYTPAYYYGEVYPLANFMMACDAKNNVYDIYSFCWNKNYTPPTPTNDLPVMLKAVKKNTAAADVCPTGVQLQQEAVQIATAALNAMTEEVLRINIGTGTSTCVAADATRLTNTTIFVPAKLVPAAGIDLTQLRNVLLNASNPMIGVDICDNVWATCPSDVDSLWMNFNTNVAALRAALTKAGTRKRMRKMTVKVTRTKKAHKLGDKQVKKKSGKKGKKIKKVANKNSTSPAP